MIRSACLDLTLLMRVDDESSIVTRFTIKRDSFYMQCSNLMNRETYIYLLKLHMICVLHMYFRVILIFDLQCPVIRHISAGVLEDGFNANSTCKLVAGEKLRSVKKVKAIMP